MFRQTGEGRKNLVEASRNLQTEKLKLDRVVHRGSVLVFVTKFNDVVLESFSDTYDYMYSSLSSVITQLLHHLKGIKVSIRIFADLQDLHSDAVIKDREFFTPYMRVVHDNFIMETILLSATYAIKSLNLFQLNGSGWALTSIKKMEVIICQYTPVRPHSYIKTPKCLKRGTIYNIRCQTDCFLLSVLCSKFRSEIQLPDLPGLKFENMTKQQKQRVKNFYQNPSSYAPIIKRLLQENEINIAPFLNSPIPLNEIDRFEELVGIGITVWRNEGNHTNLLLLLDDQDRSHYACIPRISHYLGQKNNKLRNFCIHCCKPIGLTITDHESKCNRSVEKKLSLGKETHVKFSHFSALQDFAFKAFYKIQCYNVPIEEPDVENPDDMKYSNKVADLLCASYGIVVVGPSNEIVFEKVYDGPNVMEDFFTEVFRIQEDAFQLLRNFMVPLRPSRTDKDNHSAAKTCPICQLPFDKKRIKVYHHNHLIPGQEILIWCGLCNIKAKQKAVVFIGHKTSHLDSHVILNSLRPELVRAATILTKGSNEIISLTIRPSQSSKARCRFIDSHRFMQEEMKNLVAQLKSKNVGQVLSSRFPLMSCSLRLSQGILI